MRLVAKFLIILSLASCSSGTKSSEDKGVVVPQVYVGPIQMRRPAAPPINPKEAAGSDRYARKNEADDSTLECQSIDQLFNQTQLQMVLVCLATLKDPIILKFQLLRHTEPEWVLQVSDDTPDCLVENLSYIPIPREVFFLADHEGVLSCINGRIDIERDDSLDSVWNETETKMSIFLGKDDKPKSVNDAARTLKAWALSPFFGKDKSLHGKTVPRKMCQACFKNEKLFNLEKRELPKLP